MTASRPTLESRRSELLTSLTARARALGAGAPPSLGLDDEGDDGPATVLGDDGPVTGLVHRVKFVRFDENLRLRGLEMRDSFRGPQIDAKTGALVPLDDVHMTLDEATSILRITREGSGTHLMHFSRAWYAVLYGPDELRLVDAALEERAAGASRGALQ